MFQCSIIVWKKLDVILKFKVAMFNE